MNFLRLDDRTSVRDLVTIQRDKLRGVKVDSGRVDCRRASIVPDGLALCLVSNFGA